MFEASGYTVMASSVAAVDGKLRIARVLLTTSLVAYKLSVCHSWSWSAMPKSASPPRNRGHGPLRIGFRIRLSHALSPLCISRLASGFPLHSNPET